jgi:two-component system, NtrC family, sensor kinase
MQELNEAITPKRIGKTHLEPLAEAIGRPTVNFGTHGEKFAEVAHDARNMVSALACFCDLLEAPGVLTEPYQHYGNELKLVAAASRRLIDKLLTLDGASAMPANDTALNVNGRSLPEPSLRGTSTATFQNLTPKLIDDFAWELQMNRNLLAALAGPSITLTVDTPSGALPVQMHCEDLTRILVNLVKNAVEAMPTGGRIRLTTSEVPTAPGENACVLLNVEDNGPGIPPSSLERIFETGYTTRSIETDGYGTWNPDHHGLGLAITRSIVERAGGRIHAANRDPLGTCFQIELPARPA